MQHGAFPLGHMGFRPQMFVADNCTFQINVKMTEFAKTASTAVNSYTLPLSISDSHFDTSELFGEGLECLKSGTRVISGISAPPGMEKNVPLSPENRISIK